MSYMFYEAQQSGKLPNWNRVRADKACGWRHDAHLDEGKAIGKDLVGGYYDAGGGRRGGLGRARERNRAKWGMPRAGAAPARARAARRPPGRTDKGASGVSGRRPSRAHPLLHPREPLAPQPRRATADTRAPRAAADTRPRLPAPPPTRADYLKCPHPLAWTLANLVLSAEEFSDGYKSSGNWDAMLHNVKAMSDWLIKAHLVSSDDPAANKFVGQISARPDHWYFGRPEHSKVNRVIYTASAAQPGADLAAEYAAGFAAAATLFRGVGQKAYAATLFKHAKQAFAFAEAFPKK